MSKQTAFFKRSVLALAAITLLFTFNACNRSNTNDDNNIQRFKDAAMNLGNTRHTLVDEFDYWPECGIRVTGSHLASLISLNELQNMLPCPLYVSGPHHDGQWDLNNEDDFGHYNPKAIQYLANLAKKVVSDKAFVAATQLLVDEYLYRQMHIMMVLHDALYLSELYSQEEIESIFQEMLDTKGYGDMESSFLIGNLRLEDDSYVYGNIGNQFLYFWARRWKDGTIDAFYDGLSAIFKAYNPDYEYSLDMYWIGDGEWEEWYEGDDPDECESTSYDCFLEEDEPVGEDEHIGQKEALYLIRTAVNDLGNSRNVLDEEFDYWPECGLRITGSHLFSLLSLRTLNRILPCPLYVSGPHHYNRWELNCPYTFGYYNPEAIRFLGKLAEKIVSEKRFVDETRPLVDEYLKRQMFILRSLYDGLNENDNKQEILGSIMSCEGHTYYDEESPASLFLRNMDLEDGSFVYSNTGEMFLYWWARRNVDGTMELFHDALETIYTAYYPD